MIRVNKVWAFLISVAKYDDESRNLTFVHNDNDCIKKGLKDGLLIPEEQIVVCGNDCYVNYSDFQALISSYSERITDSDRVIVFFSGHGGGAPYSLRFSDMNVDFLKFCDDIDTIAAYAKILIIDACYSGNGEIPETLANNPSHNLFEYARSGYAIFASSNEGCASNSHPEKAVSLYTHCFSNALCNAEIRNGKVSLIDVSKLAAYEVSYISKSHGIMSQHPIYKCYVPGDVLFQVSEEKTIEKNLYSACNEHYDVYSTEVNHSAREMRYNVFAIAKGDINDEIIALYTNQIVQDIKPMRKFLTTQQSTRFSQKTTSVIFFYWGKNEEDIVRRNWTYMSIWADPLQYRDQWYRIDKNARIVSDIWVKPIQQNSLILAMYEKPVSNVELIQLTHEIADPLLSSAREVVRYFEEYENELIPESAFIQASAESFKMIHRCFMQMADIPVPSVELKAWLDCYDSLAATIDDMRLIYTTQTSLSRDENNRKISMQGKVKKYRDDMNKLADLEAKLKETGVIN